MILFTKKYKEILICLILFTQTHLAVLSQTMQIKEDYESILFLGPSNMGLSEFLFAINSENVPIRIDGSVYQTYDRLLGDRFGAVFSSYLAMYRATGDKAYLHKFISETYFVQQFRNDLQEGIASRETFAPLCVNNKNKFNKI